MKHVMLLLLLAASALAAVSVEEIRFLLDKEQFALLERHSDAIGDLLSGSRGDLDLALEYAVRAADDELALRCHENLALRHHSLENALEWFRQAQSVEMDSLSFASVTARMREEFSAPEDGIILDYFLFGTPEDEYLERIRQLRGYNPVIETLAKSWIDEISVEPSDSLAMALIDRFDHQFPHSKWAQLTYYYRLFHLSRKGDYSALEQLIQERGAASSEFLYISALYLLGPAYRRHLGQEGNSRALEQAIALLDSALKDYSQEEDIQVLYDLYPPSEWANRLKLTRIKASYYQILAGFDLYGDEEQLLGLLNKPGDSHARLLKDLETIDFADNDNGELAELHFWMGKVYSLVNKRASLRQAAWHYVQSLVYGSPRKKYDGSCAIALEELKTSLGVKSSVTAWSRKLMKYQGPFFIDHPFPDQRFTRVAIGDYDNDGFDDLLFNGNSIFHNDHDKGFSPLADAPNLAGLNSNGGLWADFNKDGLLDFATISNASEGRGEALLKNMDKTRFVKVNERAGDIDDGYPTEGAAWVDIDGRGYPSLYTANYEKWQEQSGFPDFFWHNDRGYFRDASQELGFLEPDYTRDPGQAGRGVAPADFDNDGVQEILVTNYRLDRNFLWDQQDGKFTDFAALTGLAGKYKEGYYGHSIGADWGDFDNDGDLDLFIANLAHPRYIDISDISQLLRNDGLAHRVVERDTIWFWQFTDVTRQAGITYDELHSDPLWLDADNDGWLDLFVTSVYENDRSYLYKNNGDGTFTDITWLAGVRVYNGWGNATADLDRDGLSDLVVGSGNGTRIFFNRSKTKYKSLCVKPVWKGEEVVLLEGADTFPRHPNSPAYGTRVKVTLKSGSRRYSLIRELSSAKGTTSQSSQELFFGLGKAKIVSIEKVSHAQDQN